MWFKKSKEQIIEEIVTPTCKRHHYFEHKLDRIEGENISILALLAIILVFVIERLI